MNMTLHSLLELEGMMAVLMAVGYLVYRRGIVTEKGKQSLVNLCIAFIIPCNIIQAFCKEQQAGTLGQLGRIFFISVTAHLFCILAGRFLFERYPKAQRSVLQYATVCSNGGFMGNAVAGGGFRSDRLGICLHFSDTDAHCYVGIWTRLFFRRAERKGNHAKNSLSSLHGWRLHRAYSDDNRSPAAGIFICRHSKSRKLHRTDDNDGSGDDPRTGKAGESAFRDHPLFYVGAFGDASAGDAASLPGH